MVVSHQVLHQSPCLAVTKVARLLQVDAVSDPNFQFVSEQSKFGLAGHTRRVSRCVGGIGTPIACGG